MRHLRVLRLVVLLAAVLVALAVAFYLLRGRGAAPPGTVSRPASSSHTTAKRLEFTDLLGGGARGAMEADEVEQRPDGSFRLKGIRRLQIERKGAPPLVIRAQSGVMAGKPGARTVHVEGGIEMEDDDRGMRLRVEALDWDEKAEEVRSSGTVALRSPEMEGSAASLVYGVSGRPTVLVRPELRTVAGQTLTSERALLHDGSRDVELEGAVTVRGSAGGLDAERVRLLRPAAPGLQRAHASGGVRGSATAPRPGSFRASEAEVEWSAGGEVTHLQLRGEAEVAQGEAVLSASFIDATRPREAPAAWDLLAKGGVRAASRRPDGVSRLRAEELRGRMIDGGMLRADASGSVRADSPQGIAEGETMELRTEGGARRLLVLGAGGAGKASLLQGRGRVAGDRILVDEGRGTTLAEGHVEATLLPGEATARAGPFRTDAPVHFVAERLLATERGDHLLFTGSVRGWQGERNLSGARVEMDQGDELVTARGSVTSRLPRSERAAVSEADYVQIGADAMDYRGKEGAAAYSGNVRLRQSEGWLQASRLDGTLAPGGDLTGVLAQGDVSFEFRAPGRDGRPQRATGKGDRVQYVPQEQLVRLFGDRAPATVRKDAPEGGTTEGRVLRYRLDSGVLEVESGARDRGRIETSGT